ncbi:hypothetical protein [Salibacterium sp. K-3]
MPHLQSTTYFKSSKGGRKMKAYVSQSVQNTAPREYTAVVTVRTATQTYTYENHFTQSNAIFVAYKSLQSAIRNMLEQEDIEEFIVATDSRQLPQEITGTRVNENTTLRRIFLEFINEYSVTVTFATEEADDE